MFEENELVMILLGGGVFVLTRIYRKILNRIEAVEWLLTSFHILLAGWLVTVLEGFFWPDLLNLAEHICYALSSALLAWWCWRINSAGRIVK